MASRVLWIALILLCSPFAAAQAQDAQSHYFWRPASDNAAARPWAVLLPGSGGMSILGDDQHYFRAAAWLNERGVDALVIDYHGAARFVPNAAAGTPGDRMAAIVADALLVERAAGRVPRNCPCALIGWSLGSEGAWTLAASNETGFRAAAMFYPTVRRPQPYRNVLPILVFQGTADNVTKESDLRSFLSLRSTESASVQIMPFEGAGHGFDVPSLRPARNMRFPPLIGQRVTFEYDAAAATSAYEALESFLRIQGVVGGACSSG